MWLSISGGNNQGVTNKAVKHDTTPLLVTLFHPKLLLDIQTSLFVVEYVDINDFTYPMLASCILFILSFVLAQSLLSYLSPREVTGLFVKILVVLPQLTIWPITAIVWPFAFPLLVFDLSTKLIYVAYTLCGSTFTRYALCNAPSGALDFLM